MTHIETLVLALASGHFTRDLVDTSYMTEREQEEFNRQCRYYGVTTKTALKADALEDFNYVGSKHHY